MSLIAPKKTFRVGVIAAKGFDNPDYLPAKFGPHLEEIMTVYTNGVNSLVTEFCQTNGLTYTVFPVSRNTLWSNGRIVENSDKIYILSTPTSHNTELVKKECEKQGKPFEVFEMEPLAGWKEKVCRAQEILGAATEEDLNAQPVLKALKGIL